MATVGQIIFWSMIFLIVLFAGLIILILAVAFSVSQGSVVTTSPWTVGNLGQDVLLGCTFTSSSGSVQSKDVTVSWLKDGVSGVVCQFKNNAVQQQGQNTQFTGRAQIFSDGLSAGNASLLLRQVKLEDDGVYRCTVSAPKVSGTVAVNLGVAAFSAPTFTFVDGVLSAKADRWFPRPEVFWSSSAGERLNSSTQFSNDSAGIVNVLSILDTPAKAYESYGVNIQNLLVQAVSEATLSENSTTETTYFTFSAASTEHLVKPLLLSSLFIFYGILY